MSKVIAAYGGGFKPPTKGHLEVVKKALESLPEIDEFIIYVGSKERNGVSQAESILIWDIFKKYLPMKVKIEPAKSPIGDIVRLGKNNPEDEVYFIIGGREGRDDDLEDIESRTKNIESAYPNMKVKVQFTQDKGMSGTNARKAAKISSDKLSPFLPDELDDSEKEEIFNILRPVIKEEIIALDENASYTKDINLIERLAQLTQHMLDKGMNIEPLPNLEFVNGDSENASEFFGKTAYYDPNTQTIVLYTEGRHPKDIARSYTHEMVHHIQNLEDRLGAITTTNTQEDDKLNDIEAEANLKGTMTFRNWTDSLNEAIVGGKLYPFKVTDKTYDEEDNSLITTEYKFITPNNTYRVEFYSGEYNPEVKTFDLSFGVDKGESNTIDTFQMTGEGNAKKIFNTILNIVEDFIDKEDVEKIVVDGTDEKRKRIYKKIFSLTSPKILDKIELNEAIVGNKVECDKCGWSWKIADGGDDLFICHKCGNDNEPINEAKPYKHKHGFDDKLGKDPFGLNQFAREIAEGALLPEEEVVSSPPMEYKIYSDMDGVLTDFDKSFEKYSKGIPPREYEKKFGKDGFWKLIDGEGKVGFWVGMPWMEDAKQYWDYIKDYDVELLSSPSRSETSRLGKRLWVRNNMPGIKLTLAQAYNKKNYAEPNHILIDDRKSNIEQWKEAGGIGILHTSAADTINQLKALGL